MEIPIKLDDLGENPRFLETPISCPEKTLLIVDVPVVMKLMISFLKKTGIRSLTETENGFMEPK